jgi:transposase
LGAVGSTWLKHLSAGGVSSAVRVKLKPRRPAMMILSIDLAKAKSLFCWFNTADQSHRLKTVLSTPQAFPDALIEQPVDRVVIEVCDMAGWIQDLCQTLGIPIQIVNVNTEGWRWKNVKSKTDKSDVLKLARLSAAGDVKLVHLPDRATRQWRSLILYRQKFIERRTAVKNSIHALLVQEGRPMKGGNQAWHEEGLAPLRKLARPLEQCSTQEQLWSGHLGEELKTLDHLNEQIARLDQKLDELGEADARVVISKAGCSKLRKLLREIAWGMLRHNAHGQKVFARISKGQKTRRKQAAVALARRVLVWCWAMLRDGTDWREPAVTTLLQRS